MYRPRRVRAAGRDGSHPCTPEEGDMPPSELELYSTRELIQELMRRQTFLGVVVHSEPELRTGPWSGERVFTVHLNSNMGAAEAGRLLEVIAGRMERAHG